MNSPRRFRTGRNFHPTAIYVEEDSYLGGHGAALLYIVREGIARNWNSMCRVFGYSTREFHSGHFELRTTIQELQEANLLACDPDWRGKYALTEVAYTVLHALGVSLPQAANLPYHSGLGVQPFFRKPELNDIGWHVFVLMPFDPALAVVYKSIKVACSRLKVTVARADDIFSAAAVLDDITEAVYNAGIIVADCTSRNANVFYELGISHTLGKRVVLLAQDTADVPFDISYIRYIIYDLSPRGLMRLQSSLTKTLRNEGRFAWRPLHSAM